MSGRINDGFIDQHDRNSVPHRVHSAALGTLQTLALVFQGKCLLADRADQDVEQVLRNHEKDFTLFWKSALDSQLSA
jgi:hypothetical protein